MVSIGFRTKLLLALTGMVVLLGGASILAVRYETHAQVDWVVERAADRARVAFAEVERLRGQELEQIGRRFARNIRVAAVLEAALEYDEPGLLVQVARDELELAHLTGGLAIFTDLDGRPVVTLLHGEVVEPPADAPIDPLVERLLEGEPEPVSGYRLVDGELFVAQALFLERPGFPLGTLTLGYRMDDAVAERLGEVIGGEVCFAAAGRCAAATPAVAATGLERAMVDAAVAARPLITEHEGRRLALQAATLTDGGGGVAARVIASPLDEVLTPFERIARMERAAAAAALVLAIVLGILLSRGLSRPVATMAAATRRIARGDYEFEVPVQSRDELGVLAGAFNNMLEGLRLKERYRGVLDKVVSRDIADELLKGEIALGGENRRISVLFADVREFTALTEGMEPQEVITMLNEWFALAGDAVAEEQGVVDKYVGDEIMAIFGAPMVQQNHAAHAIRAAVRLRERLDALNRERVARSEPEIRIGTGINTGLAVAGNVGSPDRLNYTVLGETVNVASRLCSAAEPGQILISEATLAEAGDRVHASPVDAKRLKGLSYTLVPYQVESLRDEGVPADSAGSGAVRASGLVALLLAGAITLTGAPHAAAQTAGLPDTPTLDELGLRYISPGGWLQIFPSGRLDLDYYVPQEDPPGLIAEVESFAAPRLSLFVDAFAGERIYALAELRADRGEAPGAGAAEVRAQQAFLRFSPLSGREIHVQVGKFASPFGNYAQRHRSPADPFIRPPLFHDHRTLLHDDAIPGPDDVILEWTRMPADTQAARRAGGAPIIWGVPYQTGAMVFGQWRDFDVRLALMNGAPSARPDEWNPRLDQDRRYAHVAHLGYRLRPELRLGVSYTKGPWMRDTEQVHEMMADHDWHINTYSQEILGFEAAFARGLLETRAELLLDSWQVPNVDPDGERYDASDMAYYVEARLRLVPGFYMAGRFNAIHFGEVEGGDGTRRNWDQNVRRIQIAAGYRLSRHLELRTEYLYNVMPGFTGRVVGPDQPIIDRAPRDDLISIQLWLAF